MKAILYYFAYMFGLIGHATAIILIVILETRDHGILEFLLPIIFLLTAVVSFIMLSFYLYWHLNGDFDPNI